MNTVFSETLLSRIEDAGLNASAPPQQRWMDGWLLRTNPGSARRARCVNAVAPGRLALPDKLASARTVFDEAGLPLVMRMTRFTQPATLDTDLAELGWTQLDDTHVLVCTRLPDCSTRPPPAGTHWQPLDTAAFVSTIAALRGATAAHEAAHAERLGLSPVPYQGGVLLNSDGAVLACGQMAREGDLVGLYDIHTLSTARNQGLASWLCKHLLTLAAQSGNKVAYLQVDASNLPALAVYRRLGFEFGYSYHYRQPPEAVPVTDPIPPANQTPAPNVAAPN